jgi:hypothetical protein
MFLFYKKGDLQDVKASAKWDGDNSREQDKKNTNTSTKDY